jgi:hypothetical protein
MPTPGHPARRVAEADEDAFFEPLPRHRPVPGQVDAHKARVCRDLAEAVGMLRRVGHRVAE